MKVALLEKLLTMNHAELYAYTFKDPLTGVLNRKAFELAESVFIAIVDADSLKYVNDTDGHVAGDELLRRLATRLADNFGEGNVYRLGGDEFAIRSNVLHTAYVKLLSLQKGFPRFSFGLGVNLNDADEWLKLDKLRRLKAGLRAARGERPEWYGR